jgi:hypothetical protein
MLGAGGWPLGWIFPISVVGMFGPRRMVAAESNGTPATAPYAFVDALHDAGPGASAVNTMQCGVVTHAPTSMQVEPSVPEGRSDHVIEDSNAAVNAEAAINKPLVPSIGPSPYSNLDRVGAQDGAVSFGQHAAGPAFLDARWEAPADGHGELLCFNDGQKENMVLGKAVLRVYLRSTMMPGGQLEYETTYAEKALRQSDSSSVLYTRL